MSLESLHEQLTELARRRVHAGEATERGLARQCGVSQPHMHNVLKGVRALSVGSADRLLSALNISVPELIWQTTEIQGARIIAIPVVRNRIGPGTNANLTHFGGYFPFPRNLTAGLTEPVAGHVAADLVLPREIHANDLALLDQNPALRAHPPAGGCWVVAENGVLRIRYVKLENSRLSVANELNLPDPGAWRSFPAHEHIVLEVVRARIVWIGREFTPLYS